MTAKGKVEDIAGRVCKVLLPIKAEYYLGKGKNSAVCTLADMSLLEEISRTDAIMNRVLIAGRLLSENKGIDEIIKFSDQHQSLDRIILCGREAKGHMPGQALLALLNNGIDARGRIIGAIGHYPYLVSDSSSVAEFRKRITIVHNLIGTEDIRAITNLVV